MVCNHYDVFIHDLKQYANDKRRSSDTRAIFQMAADVLADANRELKACQEENARIKGTVRDFMRGFYEMKKIFEE